jgi:hypothetical protein
MKIERKSPESPDVYAMIKYEDGSACIQKYGKWMYLATGVEVWRNKGGTRGLPRRLLTY